MARRKRRRSRPTIWQVPDELWELIEPVIPKDELRPSGGRPWRSPRQILDGVLYVLRTGCQWKALPEKFGSGSTCHRRFQRWVELGVWVRMHQVLAQHYDALHGLEWRWQSADSSLHKAPLGGGKNRGQSDRPSQAGYEAARAYRGPRGSGGAVPHRSERP